LAWLHLLTRNEIIYLFFRFDPEMIFGDSHKRDVVP
jgi:hypothetical protein